MRKKLSEIQPGERFECYAIVFQMIGECIGGFAVQNVGRKTIIILVECGTEYEIVPPEPKYRPFKDAAEFGPHRDRWVRWSWRNNAVCRVTMYHVYGCWIDGRDRQFLWDDALEELNFDDGSPFGVLETSDE